jgi:hypothetical protein
MTFTSRAPLRPLWALASLGLLLSACTKERSQPPPPPPAAPAEAPSAAAQADAGLDAVSLAKTLPAPDEPAEDSPPNPDFRHGERPKEETETFPASVRPKRVPPAVLARLSKSLATIEGGNQDVAVVVGRQGDRLYLLSRGASDDMQVTYRSGAKTQKVSGARVVRYDEWWHAYLLSAPAPKFPVPPLPVEPLQQQEHGSVLLVARSGAKPRLEPVPVLSQKFIEGLVQSVEVDIGQAGHTDGLLIDPVRGRLVASVDNRLRQTGKREASSATWLARAGEGRLTRALLTVTPEVGERCGLKGELVVEDPLGHTEEVGLSVTEPGQEASWREAPDIEEIRTPVARASLRPDGTVLLQTTLEPCRAPRSVQVWIRGKHLRSWSQPVLMPQPRMHARSWTVATGAKHWQVVTLDGKPLKSRSSMPSAPVPPNERCKPLDPNTVYLRGSFVSQSCFNSNMGTGVAALLDQTGQRRCLSLINSDTIESILPDGWMLDAKEGVYRLRPACPRFESTSGKWAMPAVALEPCGPNATVRSPAFFRPDGEPVFQCHKGYADVGGLPVDFHGGTLVRLGQGGRSLVVAPRGGLAVLGPDGIADEVLGVPEDACVQESCHVASYATDTGFLVALRLASLDELPGAFHLFEIGFDGQAKDRGAFPSLPGRQREEDIRLDGQGRLFVSSRSSPQVYLLEAGQSEARPLLQQQTIGSLLGGPRGSGPTELKRPEMPATSDTWKYRRPRQLGTECDSRLQRFDPERLYLFETPKVWDAEDATQQSFGFANEEPDVFRVTPQGQLLYASRRDGYKTFVPDDWRRKPGTKECLFDAAGQRPDPKLHGCEGPEDRQLDVRTRPDSDALVYTCQESSKGYKFYLVHDGKRIQPPGTQVLGTGPKGLVLVKAVESFKEYLHLVRPKGASVPVQGLPEGMKFWAARSSAEGIDLLLVKQPSMHESPKEPPELWTVDASGKLSRVGAFPADLVAGGRRLKWAQLGPKRSVYAAYVRPDGTADVVVRAELGEAAPKVLFQGPVSDKRMPITGP